MTPVLARQRVRGYWLVSFFLAPLVGLTLAAVTARPRAAAGFMLALLLSAFVSFGDALTDGQWPWMLEKLTAR